MMVNSRCAIMGSLKTENSCSNDMKKAASSSDLDPNSALTLPALKYVLESDEVAAQSPENSLWEPYFSDLLENDFMISSPIGYSPPKFSPQFGLKSKGHLTLSPLHRVFSSPNNNKSQLMETESLSQLELEGFLDRNYERDIDDMLAYLPAKHGYDDDDEGSGTGTFLDCFAFPNDSSFCGGSGVVVPLSQQLEQEREIEEEEERRRNLLTHHQAPPPLHDASDGFFAPPHVPPELDQDSGLQLVHLLLACAEAVAKEDYMPAQRYLHHLNRIVSPLGDSMQRVVSCFTEALTARLASTLSTPLNPPNKPPFTPFPPNDSLEILKIYQILYQACPYIKFAHFTANQAIFEAFESEECVHVIDLDILQGYQWPAFMQALAARPNGPPFLRITGVGPDYEGVRETGRCLTELAHSLHVPLEFHPVGVELEDLRPHMFNRRVGEALAVNSVNRLHRVGPNSLGGLLTMVRDQAPNIVTIVEQEAGHNGPYFLGRFLEALHYYSAIFDSLDATFPSDSAQRAKVEQYIFAPEIRNIVATEGVERVVRHERLEKWRKVMEGKGFEGVALSSNAVTQSKILLGLYSCDGYRLTEDKGCLLLGWQDRAILAASAWRC